MLEAKGWKYLVEVTGKSHARDNKMSRQRKEFKLDWKWLNTGLKCF